MIIKNAENKWDIIFIDTEGIKQTNYNLQINIMNDLPYRFERAQSIKQFTLILLDYWNNLTKKIHQQHVLMKKYQIQNSIGSGNFSTVFKAILLPQQAPCAVKIVHKHSNIAVWQATLLRKFKHPNIISILDFQQHNNQSRLVLQYVGINTLQLYEAHHGGLKQHQVKCILFQVALGLTCVHAQRIIHRDIKPENILIDKKQAIVKIIDFGLSIEENRVSTDYIATRWYRAPENLLCTRQYTCAIDVFALACVVIQLLVGYPLFPGTNNIDQLYKIFNLLGAPTKEIWPKGYERMQEMGIRFNTQNKQRFNLRSIINNCDSRLLQILQKMLELNPKNRISCEQILRNSYFKDIRTIVPSSVFKRYQEDILRANSKKSLNFKGFQPTKSSKNGSKQIAPIQSKINFHHVSAKVKQTEQQQNSIAMYQPTRNQKSSSLDSRQVIVQLPLSPLNISLSPQNQPAQQSNVITVSRKLSTPSFLSSPAKDITTLRNSSLSLNGQVRNHIKNNQTQTMNNFQAHSDSNCVQMIPDDNQTEMKIKIPIADSSETTTHSKLSGRMENNTWKIPSLNLQQGVPFYSQKIVVPSQKNQHQSNQNASNSKQFNRIVSPQASLRDQKLQSLNSSIKMSHDISKYPVVFNISNIPVKQSPLQSSFNGHAENSNNNSFSNLKPLEISPKFVHQNQNKEIKRIRNFPELRNNIPQFIYRDNHVSPIPRNFIEKLTLQQQNYKNNQSPNTNHQYLMSPSQRIQVGSPINYFNDHRQRRMQAINTGIAPFFSPPQRKL